MKPREKKGIADQLIVAGKILSNAFASYRPYGATLNHKSAIDNIDLAIRHLEATKAEILKYSNPAEGNSA